MNAKDYGFNFIEVSDSTDKSGILIFLGTFKGQSLVQAPLVLSPEESACPPAHQPLDHDPDHGGG